MPASRYRRGERQEIRVSVQTPKPIGRRLPKRRALKSEESWTRIVSLPAHSLTRADYRSHTRSQQHAYRFGLAMFAEVHGQVVRAKFHDPRSGERLRRLGGGGAP